MSAKRKEVTVIDYGIGNLFSVVRAFSALGATVRLVTDGTEAGEPDRLVLPGVGAFAKGRAGIAERGFEEVIRTFISRERPFLGICLGMQLMFSESHEFGVTEGLSIIPGKVIAISEGVNATQKIKVPHIGWGELITPWNGRSWNGTVLQDLHPGGDAVYFTHSFMAVPSDDRFRLADCMYEGATLAAAVQKGPSIGCQFHPEKSGTAGLALLRRFLDM